jgi:hypothetical protein
MPVKKLLRLLFWRKPKTERELQELVERLERAKLQTSEPTLRFKQSWAYGNAGLEDENITEEQAKHAVNQ